MVESLVTWTRIGGVAFILILIPYLQDEETKVKIM